MSSLHCRISVGNIDFGEIGPVVRFEGDAGERLSNFGISTAKAVCQFFPELRAVRISHDRRRHLS